MKNLVNLWIVNLIILTIGCTHVPFEEVAFEPLSVAEATGIRDQFDAEIPKVFDVMESAVFTFKGREIHALSYTHIDEVNKELSVGTFTAAGLEIVQIQLKDQRLSYHFNLPMNAEKMDQENLAQEIVRDIQHIYFDRVPSALASMEVSKDHVTYVDSEQGYKSEWIFGGPEKKLYKKRRIYQNKILWTVRYYSYVTKNNVTYPSEIYYENHQRNYYVTLRLKEILE